LVVFQFVGVYGVPRRFAILSSVLCRLVQNGDTDLAEFHLKSREEGRENMLRWR
jgi:hypothetical protein